MDRASIPQVPLHLTALAILSPGNAPLYVRSFTGKEDELRHYHLAHAAVDVIEERIIMNSTPNKPADSYLGLLFCMEDMAFYGFQSASKIRMVLSVALVDALIKDSDIVAIFRAVYHLLLTATHNPFISLTPSFHARPSVPTSTPDTENKETPVGREEATGERRINNPVGGLMFATAPEDIKGAWLAGNRRFEKGIERIGEILSDGR